MVVVVEADYSLGHFKSNITTFIYFDQHWSLMDFDTTKLTHNYIKMYFFPKG